MWAALEEDMGMLKKREEGWVPLVLLVGGVGRREELKRDLIKGLTA